MKKVWWSVPLYCVIASWICFQLEVRLLGKWALITLPDGSISSDTTRWLIMSACLFIVIVLIGGLLFFRKMSRKEILFSALILVGINVVMGLISLLFPTASTTVSFYYWGVLSEWDSVIGQICNLIMENNVVIYIISWIIPPFVFVPFGKKSQ